MSLFNNAKDIILQSGVNFLSDDLRVLLKSGTPLDATASTLADIPAPDRVAIQPLTGRSLVAGGDPKDIQFRADDTLFAGLSGLQVTQIIIYKQDVTDALSPLIWFSSANFMPSGTDQNVEWGTFVFAINDRPSCNDWYFNGKNLLLQGQLNFIDDTIHAVLFDNTYTPDVINDTILADIPPSSRIGSVIGFELTSKKVGEFYLLDAGVFDAADVVMPALAGPDVDGIALFRLGSPSQENDSKLIGYMVKGSNFPFALNASLTGIIWSQNDKRILAI
jgi:hypothetical protein